MKTGTVGLHHRFCQDVRCKQCLSDHEYFGKELKKRTGNSSVDHLGKFRMWIENQVDYEVETEWGWAHPDTITEEYANAYVEDFLAKEQDNLEEARLMTESESEQENENE